MEDYLNLVGKCCYVHNEYMNALLYIEKTLCLDLHYLCRKLVRSTIGYFSDTDIIHFGCNDFIEVNPIVLNKIYKILEMNTIFCNTIIQNCKRYESPTGYYVSTFPTKSRYKLFEVLENSQILTRFSNTQARTLTLKTDSAIKFEKCLALVTNGFL